MLDRPKMKSDRRYSCLPNTTGQDIDAIILLLVSSQEGAAHRMRVTIPDTSAFMQRALDCMGAWLKITVPGKKASTKHAVSSFVQGQAAAHLLYVKLGKLDVHHREDADLLQLLSFQWLLGDHSRDMLDTWIEELVRKTKQEVVNTLVIADDPLPASASSSSAASSSPSGTLALKVTMFAPAAKKSVGPASKKQKTCDTGNVSMHENMMKICCGKST